MSTINGDAPQKTGVGITAVVFGWIAIIAVAVSLVTVLLGFAVDQSALLFVATMLLLPLTAVVGGLAGLVAVILAIVAAVKSQRRDRRWVTALVLGIIGLVLSPLTYVVLFFVFDIGGFV